LAYRPLLVGYKKTITTQFLVDAVTKIFAFFAKAQEKTMIEA
jgi:hypothetical protein